MPYALTVVEKIVSIILRLPDDLHRSLREWARGEERSLNGQIVHLLRLAVEQRGK